MRVSSSVPPDSTGSVQRGITGPGRAVGVSIMPWLTGVMYLAFHLPFLAPSLEDIDSINFALGLRAFNPALHQPQPPGYPVYMLLGHASLAVVERLTSLPRATSEALSLAVWSAIGG